MSHRHFRPPLAARWWIGLLIAPLAASAPAIAQKSERVSIDTGGVQSNGASARPSLDRTGRFVAFDSDADNLVGGDFNLATDVFLRDRAGLTDLVSRNSFGNQGNGASDSACLAGLAGFVAFRTDATNLFPADTNNLGDVVLRDLAAGITMAVSLDFAGGPANGQSFDPFVTADGRYVAFTSTAGDLVPADMNGLDDVFVRDTWFGVTDCISVNGFGVVNANSRSGKATLSANGRFAAFESDASDLVAGDFNGVTDIFVRDLVAGVTRRISQVPGGGDANGASRNPWISEDGRWVVYESDATNLVMNDVNGQTDVFLCDLAAGVTTLVSVSTGGDLGNGPSTLARISSLGEQIAFTSLADNLVPRDLNLEADVFVHDRVLGVTHRVSLGGTQESTGASGGPAISGNGQLPAFVSGAADLVTGDTNFADDVFVRDSFPAQWAVYGAGFAGTFGVPFIGLDQDPVMGTTPALELTNSRGAATPAVLFVGFNDAGIATMWGGTLLVQPAFALVFTLPAGFFSATFNVPSGEVFEGFQLYAQVLEIDPGAAFGVSFTRGLHLGMGW